MVREPVKEDKSKDKFRAVTLFIFAIICLILAVLVYIKDYGYSEFLPSRGKDLNPIQTTKVVENSK